jgi:hypothetical protein
VTPLSFHEMLAMGTQKSRHGVRPALASIK